MIDWNAKPFWILDGGLATELERRGHNLEHDLWSGRVLLEKPEAIAAIHQDYLEAGADIITTASYQITFQGALPLGLGVHDVEKILLNSVALAADARRQFQKTHPGARPLVAASIGPYGAYLHNGAEYRGMYGLSAKKLALFHERRLDVLAGSAADLIAFETIPCIEEAKAVASLLRHQDKPAWISFTCRTDRELVSGETLLEALRIVDSEPAVSAIGINCTAPKHIPGLLRILQRATGKPPVIYPNSGETWNLEKRRWVGKPAIPAFADQALLWVKSGARVVGGCCRITPEDIAAFRRKSVDSESPALIN